MRVASSGILLLGTLAVLGMGCAPPAPKIPQTTPGTPPALAGEWTLVELGGHTAPLGAGRKPGTIAFDTKASRVSGFAGCNRFSGTYKTTGDALAFGPLALTKMACDEGMDLENLYADALSRTTRFEFVGGSLTLLHEKDSLARFERPEKP